MTADHSTGEHERPLSPHLQVYRWPITMATSIAHRATGFGNAIGAIYLTAWLVAIATGPEAYATFASLAGSIFGQLILFGFTWSLLYHLCNGLRHLTWDTGTGFKPSTADFTGIVVIVASVVLTIAVWLVALAIRGGLL
ncbi:MAG: succinate dehydrogenase, cytochrome b556 subunit [Pseudomonadota bacterium]